MHTLSGLAAVGTLLFLAAEVVSGDDYADLEQGKLKLRMLIISRRSDTTQPVLTCVGGVPYFKFWTRSTNDPRLPVARGESSRLFEKRGELLRLYGDATPAGIAKDRLNYGWYLSADYSIEPPQVTLTKEPTKYSRWSYIPAGNGRYYVKNENDLGKDAWLTMAKDGMEMNTGGGVALLRKPILSFGTTDRPFYDLRPFDPREGK